LKVEGDTMTQKILVVDDNEQNLILMRDILEYYGHAVLTAQNGEEGIRLAQEHRPALILMDIQMPGMDGYAALRMLRGYPELENIKIIAVTALAMSGDKEKLLHSGFDDYLAKPVDIRQLSAMVNKHLSRE